MILRKVLFAAICVFGNVKSQETESQLFSEIPSCALPSLTSAISEVGCGIGDFTCQCVDHRSEIMSMALIDMQNACSDIDMSTAQLKIQEICDLQSSMASSSAAVSSSLATAVHVSTLTVVSTPTRTHHPTKETSSPQSATAASTAASATSSSDSKNTTTSHGPALGLVIGIVCAAVVLIILIVGVVCIMSRRRSKKSAFENIGNGAEPASDLIVADGENAPNDPNRFEMMATSSSHEKKNAYENGTYEKDSWPMEKPLPAYSPPYQNAQEMMTPESAHNQWNSGYSYPDVAELPSDTRSSKRISAKEMDGGAWKRRSEMLKLRPAARLQPQHSSEMLYTPDQSTFKYGEI